MTGDVELYRLYEPAPCPVCRADMVVRSGPHGDFLGCPRFPQCKGTRNLHHFLAETIGVPPAGFAEEDALEGEDYMLGIHDD